jgi:NitT/TauT family transport system substrate-binding protein
LPPVKWAFSLLKPHSEAGEGKNRLLPAEKGPMRMALRHARRLNPGTLFLGVGLVAAMLTSPAAAQTAVKFALDFRFEGPSAPFFLALDRGYFKAEGLDVTIEPGTGSIEPVNRVGSGAYDMGFGDINTLIRLRDQRPSTPKPVFMVYNKPPFAIVGRRSRGIVNPKDLENNRAGAPSGDAAFAQWPLFAKINGIDPAKVTVENVGFPVRELMLAAGQVDAIFGFSFSAFVGVKDRGVPVNDLTLIMMADHGLALYGNAIMANPRFAADKPEAVRGFLRAYLKGLKEAVNDPANAVEAVLKRNPVARREVEIERLRMAISENILTAETRANGYGAVDLVRLERAIDQIALTYNFKTKPKASDVFDDSYLPPVHQRQVE